MESNNEFKNFICLICKSIYLTYTGVSCKKVEKLSQKRQVLFDEYKLEKCYFFKKQTEI